VPLKLLVVDDEPHVLKSMERILREHASLFTVQTVANGTDALALISGDKEGEYFCVISDLRMPDMNGIELLDKIRQVNVNIIRILVSGKLTLESTVQAVNQGRVWHVIEKPYEKEEISNIVISAYETFMCSRRKDAMTRETIEGAILILHDLLVLNNPMAYGMTLRIHNIVRHLLPLLPINAKDMADAAARLCYAGCNTIPNTIIKKITLQEELTEDEQALLNTIPELSGKLVSRIPSLNMASEMIARQNKPYSDVRHPSDTLEADIHLGGDLLYCAIAFDRWLVRGLKPPKAIEWLRTYEGPYNPDILNVLHMVRFPSHYERGVEISLSDLKNGMRLAQNIHDRRGVLLACVGQEVTPATRMNLLKHLVTDGIHDVVLVDPYQFVDAGDTQA